MMSKGCLRIKIVVLFIVLFVIGLSGFASADEKKKEKSENTGLQHRIDFGNTYVMGQSIKSGAVYLMHRKQSELESMLKVRQDYRQEIIEEFELEKSALVKVGKESSNGMPPRNPEKK